MPEYSLHDYNDFVEKRENIQPIGVNDENNPILLPRLDFTDPNVFLDPDFLVPIILKNLDDPLTLKDVDGQNYVSNVKDDGINIPIIRLNNIQLNDEQIDYLLLSCDEFVPRIHLCVKDVNKAIQTCSSPGFDNVIALAITMEVNGYYKKIALGFYVTDVHIYDDYVAYDAIFKLQSINQEKFEYVNLKSTYNKPELTTWELLYKIAMDNKLGFASTHECKNIVDKRYRTIKTQSYIDYIQSQIEFAGVDENSIFDCWIDFYGYIILVNISWLINNTEIKPENLSINAMTGVRTTLNNGPEVDPIPLYPRILTNYQLNENESNMLFENYEQIIDNNAIYYEGALNTNYYMSSPCEENKIEIQQLQVIENSPRGLGNSQNYENAKFNFVGIEFGESSIIAKKKENLKFFNKIRSKKLKIELLKFNLGLQRGFLVTILFQEHDNTNVKLISGNKDLEVSGQGMTNMFMTGIYYIDAVEFEYKSENHKITQFIYVIKCACTPDINPNDLGITPKNIIEEDLDAGSEV